MNGAGLRQTFPCDIEPDGKHPQTLRYDHFPLQVIAHHPRFFWQCLELVECMEIDALIWLSNAKFPLDEDKVEEGYQLVFFDSAALYVCTTIRQECQPHITLP